ncbi:MAG: hypothetical protein PUF67_05085 [Firmicutes bacterium]|nr:hypothetical protein [Bacillota bacterium]
MKRLVIVLILLILCSCTSKKYDINDFYSDEIINGNVTINYEISLEEDVIPFNYAYKFNKNENMAYISVNENNIPVEIEMMDDNAFMIVDGIKYSYDEADALLASIMPMTFSTDDIVSCKKSGNIYTYVLTNSKLSSLMGISEENIISNEFKYTISEGKIISDDIVIVYTGEDSTTTFNKHGDYDYEKKELTFTSFDYLSNDYQQYQGKCRFDYGASSITNDIEIVDNNIIRLSITQTSSLDTISSFHEDIDEYVKQLKELYAGLNGVDSDIELSNDALIISHDIDMNSVDDKALSIIDIKKDGNEYMHYLLSKGYVCD